MFSSNSFGGEQSTPVSSAQKKSDCIQRSIQAQIVDPSAKAARTLLAFRVNRLQYFSAKAISVSLTSSRTFVTIPSHGYCLASSGPFLLNFALSVESDNNLFTAAAKNSVPSAINTCLPSTQGNPAAPSEVVTVGMPMLKNSSSLSRIPVPLKTGTTPTATSAVASRTLGTYP